MRGVTGPIEEIILSVTRLKVPKFIRDPNTLTSRSKDVSIYLI